MTTLSFGLIFTVAGLLSLAARAEPVPFEPCECAASSCAPCEVETGVTFFSAKCGQGNTRTKSCKKATCVPVEEQEQCLAEQNTSKHAATSETIAPTVNDGSASKGPSESTKPRQPTTAKTAKPAGVVTQLAGSAKITHASGAAESAHINLSIFQNDLIETAANSKLKIRLNDAEQKSAGQPSEIVLVADSRLRIETAEFSQEKNRRTVLMNLQRGRLRSHVNQKYEGESFYRVKTLTAIAGVRGTDFVTSFDPGENEWSTEVHTFKGRVQLSGATNKEGVQALKQVDVDAGTYASFVIKGPPPNADDEALNQLISEGSLSPVMKMSAEKTEMLAEATDFNPAESQSPEADNKRNRLPATADGVCTSPNGAYNQCSWTCEGSNPKMEKRCRTDLPGISCVRRLCRANGQWAEPQRMPANQSDICLPDKPVVRECGAYW